MNEFHKSMKTPKFKTPQSTPRKSLHYPPHNLTLIPKTAAAAAIKITAKP
jgi:hypothetical protein